MTTLTRRTFLQTLMAASAAPLVGRLAIAQEGLDQRVEKTLDLKLEAEEVINRYGMLMDMLENAFPSDKSIDDSNSYHAKIQTSLERGAEATSYWGRGAVQGKHMLFRVINVYNRAEENLIVQAYEVPIDAFNQQSVPLNTKVTQYTGRGGRMRDTKILEVAQTTRSMSLSSIIRQISAEELRGNYSKHIITQDGDENNRLLTRRDDFFEKHKAAISKMAQCIIAEAWQGNRAELGTPRLDVQAEILYVGPVSTFKNMQLNPNIAPHTKELTDYMAIIFRQGSDVHMRLYNLKNQAPTSNDPKKILPISYLETSPFVEITYTSTNNRVDTCRSGLFGKTLKSSRGPVRIFTPCYYDNSYGNERTARNALKRQYTIAKAKLKM